MTAEIHPQNIDPDLARSYFTALTLLGNSTDAEALVVEAIQSLSPEDVTSSSLRNAVVKQLVRAQLES